MGSPESSSEQEPLSSEHFYKLAWGFYLVLAVLGITWIGVRDSGVSIDLFVGSAWWKDAVLGTLAAVVLIVAWELICVLLPGAAAMNRELATLIGSLDVPTVVGLALLSGFAEELFFRGALQGSFGVVVATICFALVHTGPGTSFRYWTLFAFIGGSVMGGLMVWRGNLLAPIVCHALVNGVNLGRMAGHWLPLEPGNALQESSSDDNSERDDRDRRADAGERRAE